MKADNLSKELILAKRAALAAGAELNRHWHRQALTVIDSKGPDSPVTAADLEADKIISGILRHAFPEDGWLSEETANEADVHRARRTWVIDPLDGTTEFIQRVPEFCVSIALLEESVPVLGVIYNPVRRELYWGVRSLGCFFGKRRVRVSCISNLRRADILASRTEVKNGEWEPFRDALKIVPVGSVAYKLARVAAGFGDATFTLRPKNVWDIAAGVALVTAAGGCATDFNGKPLELGQVETRLTSFVASNCLIHEQLLKFLASRLSPARALQPPNN